MSVIALPKILADRLTEEGTKALVEIFKQVESSVQESTIRTVEERFERRLAEEIGKLRVEMHELIGNLRADIIRWMFIFWIGQAVTVIGFMLALHK